MIFAGFPGVLLFFSRISRSSGNLLYISWTCARDISRSSLITRTNFQTLPIHPCLLNLFSWNISRIRRIQCVPQKGLTVDLLTTHDMGKSD